MADIFGIFGPPPVKEKPLSDTPAVPEEPLSVKKKEPVIKSSPKQGEVTSTPKSDVVKSTEPAFHTDDPTEAPPDFLKHPLIDRSFSWESNIVNGEEKSGLNRSLSHLYEDETLGGPSRIFANHRPRPYQHYGRPLENASQNWIRYLPLVLAGTLAVMIVLLVLGTTWLLLKRLYNYSVQINTNAAPTANTEDIEAALDTPEADIVLPDVHEVSPDVSDSISSRPTSSTATI